MTDNKLLESTIEIVKGAASFIKKESSKFSADKIEQKGKNDLVSYVDKESEKMLVRDLGLLLPSSGFIAEEGTSDKTSEKYNWVIDPLDGTTNFIHGLPIFAVSVALQKRGEIILGVVYEITSGECFYAKRGEGAYLNGDPITVSENQSLADALIATGFPYYDFGKLEKFIRITKAFMLETHGVRRLGSAAIDLAYVAAGRFDGFYEYNLNAWDVAAGSLLVEEAGGQVTDYQGTGRFIANRELVAAGSLHQDMLEVIQEFW